VGGGGAGRGVPPPPPPPSTFSAVLTTLVGHDGMLVEQVPDLGLLAVLQVRDACGTAAVQGWPGPAAARWVGWPLRCAARWHAPASVALRLVGFLTTFLTAFACAPSAVPRVCAAHDAAANVGVRGVPLLPPHLRLDPHGDGHNKLKHSHALLGGSSAKGAAPWPCLKPPSSKLPTNDATPPPMAPLGRGGTPPPAAASDC
jgi:hypothetical protein